MVAPKAIQALVVALFMVIVLVGLFFLLSRQLAPLLAEMAEHSTVKTNEVTTTFTPAPLVAATLTAMNQVLAATIAPVAVSTTPTSTIAPTVSAVRVGIVNSDVINVRRYPDLAGDIIGEVKQGDQLQILAVSTDGQWLQVCCPLGTNASDRPSWVAAEFVTVQGPNPSARTPGTPLLSTTAQLVGTPAAPLSGAGNGVMGVVNSSSVNLRSGPGIMYAVVGQAQEQHEVQLTGRDITSTWWRICCPPGAPQEGWISAEFIDITISKEQALTLVPVVDVTATPSSTRD